MHPYVCVYFTVKLYELHHKQEFVSQSSQVKQSCGSLNRCVALNLYRLGYN